MNATAWLGPLLTFGAVLEALAGLGLLVAPSVIVAALLGSPLEGNGIVVAHLGGGGILGVAVACWFARHTPTSPAGLGASWAFLVYNVVACAVLTGTGPSLSGRGLLVAGAAGLHGLLAAGLLIALAARRRDAPLPVA